MLANVLVPKHHIADALSSANLLCGLLSMFFAAHGHLELSLLMLIAGAAFDGLDGAAARRWGGTRLGVYADDVADAVNYGVAPGVALILVLGGVEGLVTGLAFILFTFSRLVFFTLNKSQADPAFFEGVPSTAGGLVVLSSLVLFPESPTLVGLMVGIACTSMVSFDTHHRHVGRVLAQHRQWVWGLLGAMALILAGGLVWGIKISVICILSIVLCYGFAPSFLHFRRVISMKFRA